VEWGGSAGARDGYALGNAVLFCLLLVTRTVHKHWSGWPAGICSSGEGRVWLCSLHIGEQKWRVDWRRASTAAGMRARVRLRCMRIRECTDSECAGSEGAGSE